MRPSVVAESPEVAVPGLSLDTVGEPLLEAADECGASGEKGSMSAIGQSILRDQGPGRTGVDGRRSMPTGDQAVERGGPNESVADGLDFGRLPHKHGEDAGLLRGARSRRPSSGTST